MVSPRLRFAILSLVVECELSFSVSMATPKQHCYICSHAAYRFLFDQYTRLQALFSKYKLFIYINQYLRPGVPVSRCPGVNKTVTMSSSSSQIHGSTTSFTYSCPSCPRSYQGSTLAHIPRVCLCNRIVDSQRIVTNGNGKLLALAYSDSALRLISVGNGAASQPTSASQLDRQSILEPEPSQNRFANPRLGPPQAPPQVRNQLQVASGNSTENPPSYHNDTRPPSYRSPPPSFHSTDPLDPEYRQSSNSRAPSQH